MMRTLFRHIFNLFVYFSRKLACHFLFLCNRLIVCYLITRFQSDLHSDFYLRKLLI